MKKAMVSVLFAALFTNFANAVPVLSDEVIAIVNKDVILKSQQDALIKKVSVDATKRGQSLPAPSVIERQALERLIQDSLQLQLAGQAGLKISDVQLEQTLSDIAADNKMTAEAMRKKLEADGINYAQYREEVRNELLMQEVRRNQVRRRINVSDDEVKQVAKILKNQGATQMQFRVGHIQIALPENPSDAELNKAQAKIQHILKQLNKGADFSQLAIAESNDPRALEGGDWGWMNLQEMPTLMAEAVQGKSKGDIVGPLRSGAGLHIIKLIDTKGQMVAKQTEVKARHILLKPSVILTEAKAKAMLEGFVRDIKAGRSDFAKLAKEYSDDTGSGSQGGELGWADPSIYVPEFRDMLGRLEKGQLSQPFRTQFGWHVVQLEDTRSEESTDKAIENRARQLLLNRRFAEETQSWINELRDGAYIRITNDNNAQ